MSRSKILFKLVQREVVGVALCKDMLVVVPTDQILRGFLIEATSEKDRVYLWRVVMPLYRPAGHVFLNYSKRISDGDQDIYLRRGAIDESVDLFSRIVAEHLAQLQQVQLPQDFLERLQPNIGNPTFLFRLDLALTYGLVGKVGQALELLRQLEPELAELDVARRDYATPIVGQALHAGNAGSRSFFALLDSWTNANVSALGLEPTRNALPRIEKA